MLFSSPIAVHFAGGFFAVYGIGAHFTQAL